MSDSAERVLVLGGSGMLGHRMLEVLSGSFVTAGTVRGGIPPSPEGFFGRLRPGSVIGGVDARRFATVEACIASYSPTVVVNCIGIVRQLPEGSDPVVSIEVNSLFPHRLAAACRRLRARLIHIGTDCVFSGSAGSYREDDTPDATDLYGRSKALGEPVSEGCLTLRTSIIGRELARTTGLLEWFLSRRGGSVRGYRRAVWSGLTTEGLSRVVAEVIRRGSPAEGLFHVASEPVSKYDLLRRIDAALGLGIEVTPVDEPVEDRSLCSDKFAEAAGIAIPPLDGMISALGDDLGRYDEWRTRG
ncbi:MAG: SDR family oxidoreductase [Candidatus Fermentibacter sp.]|nr:SDR family oxidoreductase [Candidatus Fermentibacter sp.]